MKSINRRALSALVFGFLTLGASSAFAEQAQKAQGCSAGQTSYCSAPCCREMRTAGAFDQTAERFKAKYGREYPGKRPAVQTVSHNCCNNC